MKTLILTVALISAADAQPDPRNNITFSGGYARDIHAYCCQPDSAVSLGASFGYRVFPFLQLEAGLTTALHPRPEIRGATYDIKPEDRFIWVPVGVRGVLPLRRGRVELSAGGGGLYEKYSVSNPASGLGLESYDGWGGYFIGGAAASIDRGKHFWLGASPRWFLANAGYGGFKHDRWFVITGDFSFRF